MSNEVEIKKVMETDESGVQRQIFPETHIQAVIGLDELATQGTGVTSINGKKGNIILTANDLGISDMKITLEKVGEV